MKSMSGKYVCRIRVPPPLGLPGQKGFRVQEQDPHGLVDVVILSVIDPSSHFHIGDVVDFKLDKTHDTSFGGMASICAVASYATRVMIIEVKGGVEDEIDVLTAL